jgi:PIN domain nuclease of toxin-antitoxin system
VKLLCDTSVLLKMALGTSSSETLRYLHDELYVLCYSAASVWEVAIKNMAGKLALDSLTYERELNDAGFMLVNITVSHIQHLNNLRHIHKDPFDRLMLAQAICEGMQFLTTDKLLSGYHPNVICVK